MNKSWILEVQEDESTGDAVIQFPEDFLSYTGWKEGDTIEWKDLGDGSYQLEKKEQTQWVLVEAVSTFRMRYLVQTPVGIDDFGNDKTLWALDTVTCEEAKEFSQQHLGEQIVSHRVVSEEEALTLCDKDNDYASTWDSEQKKQAFFTCVKD